jgi:ribonuclease D
LAAVRSLWETRDALARERDIAPGRVLPDSALVEAAVRNPADEAALLALPVFRGRAQRRMVAVWLGAIQRAAALPRSELPEAAQQHDGPPPANRWADKDPAAAARLAAARVALTAVADANTLPVENLLLPDLVRRTCWQPPADTSVEGVAAVLREGGARRWQIELTAAALSEALTTKPA